MLQAVLYFYQGESETKLTNHEELYMSKNDQTFLTDAQVKKDIKRRHAVQKVGIELEMYSSKGIRPTDEDIRDRLGFQNWECVEDGSLYSFVEELRTSDEVRNPKIEEMMQNPIKFTYEFRGHNFQYIYDNFAHINPEATRELENETMTPSEYFAMLIENNEARDHAVALITPDLRRFDQYDSRTIERKGVEMRVASPVSFNSVDSKLKEMVAVANDSELIPVFRNPEGGNTDNSDMAGDNHGMAGLHFHFGFSQQIDYSVLDLLRLLKHSKEREDEIEDLAMRPHNRWCKKMDDIIDHVNFAINSLASNNIKDIPTNWFQDAGRFSLGDPRYFGVNVTNIGYGNRNAGKKKFNTVEFRWGNSKVVKSYESLKSYFDLLTDLVDTSFTGARVMKWFGGYTLRDISGGYHIGTNAKNVLAVISPEGKLIGRLTVSSLCDSFTGKVPTKIEQYVEEAKSIDSEGFVPRFDGVIYRDVSEQMKQLHSDRNLRKEIWEAAKKSNDPRRKARVLRELRKNRLGDESHRIMRTLPHSTGDVSDVNSSEYERMKQAIASETEHAVLFGGIDISSSANLILGA